MKTPCILACDPGKDDFGTAYVGLDGTVLEVGMVQNTVSDLTALNFKMTAIRYLSEIRKMLAHPELDIQGLTFERLTPRPGRGGGAVAEFVNFMNGALWTLAVCAKVKNIRPVMPAQWKGWLARITTGDRSLDSAASAFGYPQVKKVARKKNPFPIFDHSFDAAGLGLWFAVHPEIDRRLDPPADKQLAMYKNAKKSLDKIWKDGIRKG
jgi:hypothetical protein